MGMERKAQQVLAACPACGTANSITATDVVDDVEVRCSQCGGLLGFWHDMEGRAAAGEDQLPLPD